MTEGQIQGKIWVQSNREFEITKLELHGPNVYEIEGRVVEKTD